MARLRIQEVWWFMRGTYFAVKRGDLFPAASRQPPAPAPGGTAFQDLRVPRLPRLRELDRLVLTTHRVPIPGLARPWRIVQLSDLHVRREDRWLRGLCEILPTIRADAVVLTGDVVTKGWSSGPVHRLLQNLPRAPAYAVMGNWEHWAGATAEDWSALIAPYGVELLVNRWVDCGPITLAGTDDLLAGEWDPDATLAGAPPDRPAVVLSHSPDAFPQLARAPVRLVLSGHSHGGQIRLGRVGSFFVPRGTGRYVGGWFEQGDAHLFVTQGLGWSLAPMRIGCPPEIAVIELLPG